MNRMNMRNCCFLLVFLVSSLYTYAQKQLIYHNSFNDSTINSAWKVLDLDGITSPNPLGYNNPYGSEIVDYCLGYGASDTLNKRILTPSFQIQDNFFVEFYSKSEFYLYYLGHKELSLWATTNIQDTLWEGSFDSLGIVNSDGFNIFNLSDYANQSIRLGFKIIGQLNTPNPTKRPFGVDDFSICQKTSNAYIPDSCFRAYLQAEIPEAFIGDSLNVFHPSCVERKRIDKPGSCIESLAGINYFPGLRTLKVPYNQIYDLPVLKMNYIDTFLVNNNYLKYIPDINWCKYIDYSYNFAKNIPEYFNQTVSLFNAHSNLIYDCFLGSNRFAFGSLRNNIFAHRTCCVYYDMLFDAANYFPHPLGLPIPSCSQEVAFIRGRIYFDSNDNNIYDSTDITVPGYQINLSPGTNSFPWSTGIYSFQVPPGQIHIDISNLPNGIICENPLDTLIIDDQYMVYDFRLTQPTPYHDLELNIISPVQTLNPTTWSTIRVKNNGPFTESFTAKIAKPNFTDFVNIADYTVENDTLIWSSTIAPFQTLNLPFQLQLEDTLANNFTDILGQLYCSTDLNLSNNIDSSSIFYLVIINPEVINNPPNGFPYDPNNKLVYPSVVDSGYADYFTYNINFENIGTANATHVLVNDLLPPQLDVSTFEFLGSTHPCFYDFGLDSLIRFSFYPIQLTPTALNPDSSHGSFWFRIKPRVPLNYGDTIYNKASIIFDTQAPIQTNYATITVDDSRVAEFEPFLSTNICTGDSIVFIDKSSSMPISWEWTFEGGTISTSTQRFPSVKFENPGSFSVQLITHWNNNKSDTLIKFNYIHVHSAPNVAITITPSAAVCHGDSIILKSTIPGQHYNWSNGMTNDSLVIMTSDTISLTLIDEFGCVGNSDEVYTSILDLPTPHVITESTSICQNDSAALTLENSYNNIQWSNGSNNDTIIIGSGIFEVQVIDEYGCIGIDSITIVEYPPIELSLSGNLSVCAGDSAIVIANPGHSNYSWSDGASGQTRIFTEPGIYALTVADAYGCESSDSIQINIYNNPIFTLLGDSIFCAGTESFLSISEEFDSYYWSTGSNLNYTQVNDLDSLSITVINSNGCETTKNIEIIELQNPVISIVGDTLFCEGNQTELTVIGEYSEVVWADGDTRFTISAMQAGEYSVTATGANGCTSYTAINIIESASPIVSIISPLPSNICSNDPAALPLVGEPIGGQFTGNGVVESSFYATQASIGINVISYTYTDNNGCQSTIRDSILVDICAGINQLNDENFEFSIYPNPASNTLYIDFKKELISISKIQLRNAIGQLITAFEHPKYVNNSILSIDLTSIPNGIYFLSFKSGEREFTSKLIIQN